MLKKILPGLVLASALAGLGGCDYAYQTSFDLVRAYQRQQAGLERKEIDLPGGLHFAYLEGGKGEPLLLLHGFGANKENFVAVARYLTPHYRLIMPDHIGFGESAHPPDADYAPQAQARRLHALVQALGIVKPHLGGNSMGGMIALNYAALYPSEVASLWLLDSAGVSSAPLSELGKVLRDTGKNPLIVRNADELAALLPLVMSRPPAIPRPFLEIMARERSRNAGLEQKIMLQLIADRTEERIAGLATPALIVWGDEDRLLHPASADILHRLLPNSQLKRMPGIGHLPMVEQAQQTAQDYLHFRAALGGQ